MKPQSAFVAQRALARHCPELLTAPPPPADLVPLLSRLGEKLARALSLALAPLLGGDPPAVQASPARHGTAGELAAIVAPLAANSLIATGSHSLIASIEAEPVLRLVDRAFGGRGEVPARLPETFPLSAELMIQRLEALVCDCLGRLLPAAPRIHATERAGELAAILPYAEAEPLALLVLDVNEVGGEAWSATLAFPLDTLAALLGEANLAAAAQAAAQAAAPPRDLLAQPFADMPLTLSAVLVDTRMPFSALAALTVGQIIPVAVARSVPLRIGQTTIAHGTVGALDDRVAIQLTQAFQ